MSNLHISVPYFEPLRRPDGWNRTPDTTYGFNVIRFHYYLMRRGDAGKLYSGAPLADLSVPNGVIRENFQSISGEIERTDVAESLQKFLVELECVKKFATEVKSKVPISFVGKFDTSILAEAMTTFRSEASTEFKQSTAVTRKIRWEMTEKISIDGSKSKGPLYVVPKYRRVGYDLFLSFVDHLSIDYEKRNHWQRYRRTKSPARSEQKDWTMRTNVIRGINLPMMTVRFWELAGEKHPICEGNYEPEVRVPDEVSVEEIDRHSPTYQLPPGDVQSLYRYSNFAFKYRISREVRKLSSR